jgi:hypothetical protein
MTDRTEKRVAAVVKMFHEKEPATIDNLNLKLTPIGVSGAYRKVYRINGLPLVIKEPKDKSCRKHARAEYKTIQRILRYKKYARLTRYMPEVYYFNEKTGLMLMHYYRPLPKRYKCIARLLDVIVELTWPYAMDQNECDVHGGNVALTEDNLPVIIDLGYFSELGKGSW